MPLTRRSQIALCAAVVTTLVVLAAAPSQGQLPDEVDPTVPSSSTTTTSTPSEETSTTSTSSTTSTTVAGGRDDPQPAPAPSDDGAPDGDRAPGGDGDGGVPAAGPRAVPAEAQRIIDSVERTPPNDTEELHAGVQALVDLGLSNEDAIRLGFGRFPVGGVTRYSHDWLYPRWGPGFRFHHGTDLMAPFGTPLRAVADGTATTNTSNLGGLSVKVHLDDGTYFYYAHLSSLVDGFENGMTVETGDVVGYIGDSGNARGGSPHLHFAIYPQGGSPIDPKPILDGWLADALEQLPGIVEQVRSQRPVEVETEDASGARARNLLATTVLRPLAGRTAAGVVPTELLYQTSANPAAGGLAVAEREAESLAAAIDWNAVEQRGSAEDLVIDGAASLISQTLGPLGPLAPGDLAAG